MNRTLITPHGWYPKLNRLLKRVVRVAFIDSTTSLLALIATRVLRLNFEAIPMRYRIPAFIMGLAGTALFWTWVFTVFGATSAGAAEVSFVGMLVAYTTASVILLLTRVNFRGLFTALVLYPVIVVHRFLTALLGRWQ